MEPELSTPDSHAIIGITKNLKGYTWKVTVYQKPNETEAEMRKRLIAHEEFLHITYSSRT